MHKLVFSLEGRSSLASLDKDTAQRILNRIRWHVQNFDKTQPIPLKGNLSGLCKLRAGDWRIIYEVNSNEKIITVHKIGHRKDIYR